MYECYMLKYLLTFFTSSFVALFLCITYSMCTSEHVNIIVFPL